MVLKSGKLHHMPQVAMRSPFVGNITITECFAKKIMNGSIIEKLGTIIDVVKTHERGYIERREAKAMLLGALADESRQVRWSAVYALGQMDDLQGLLEGVGNECQVVRSMSTALIYATLRKRETMGVYPNGFTEKLTRAMADNIGSDDNSVAIYSASVLAEIAKRDPVSVIKVIGGMKEKTNDIGTIVRLTGVEMAAQDALTEISSRNRA